MSINVHYSFDLIIIPGIATAETFNFFSIWNLKIGGGGGEEEKMELNKSEVPVGYRK